MTAVVLENDESSRPTTSSRRPAGRDDALCDCRRRAESPRRSARAGQLSFVETIATLDVKPRRPRPRPNDHFFNDPTEFVTRPPEDLATCAAASSARPNNFAYDAPLESTARCASRARRTPTSGRTCREDEYRLEEARLVRSHHRLGRPLRARFPRPTSSTPTCSRPRTIRKFTGHDNGAVYGAPRKAARRHDAPREPLHLRHRPGLRRHHRRDALRHRDGQRLPTEVAASLSHSFQASGGCQPPVSLFPLLGWEIRLGARLASEWQVSSISSRPKWWV